MQVYTAKTSDIIKPLDTVSIKFLAIMDVVKNSD